jgi:hypothetical protein
MSSQRRIQASRANGARSRGPVTPEGKQRSSYNATRHGLLAICVVLPGEDPENFQEFIRQFVDRFQPVDDFEFNLIEELCAHAWRMRRAWAVEKALLSKQIDMQDTGTGLDRITRAYTALATDPTLALAQRCDARFHRMYQRVMRNLLLLRAETQNRRNEPSPINEQPVSTPADDQPPTPQLLPVSPRRDSPTPAPDSIILPLTFDHS